MSIGTFIHRSVLVTLLGFLWVVTAQSSDQNFPTPVTTNEINGVIKARDIGDPRLTTYFYTFDGTQGDVFINVVSKNFNGDIDVFTAEALAPLAKMVMYAGTDSTETGRLIYLRKPEHLILRVQGRTPNDDPATFRVKFGGSFVALQPRKVEEAPTVAGANDDGDKPGVQVNSVGTIVAVIPKPRPTPKPQPTPADKEPVARKAAPRPSATPVKDAPASAEPKKTEAGGSTVFENETAKVTVKAPPKPSAKPPAKKPATKPSPKPPPAKPKPEAQPEAPKEPPANRRTCSPAFA